MADNFQRTGSVSNAHVGRAFEEAARVALAQAGVMVSKGFPVDVGVARRKKVHKFDLGAESPPTLIECKSHRWTSGNNIPSAKLTVWNEAMYYFHCAPARYRKILFALRDERRTTGETLAAYYVRNFIHLVPKGVEIWEFDEQSRSCAVVHGGG